MERLLLAVLTAASLAWVENDSRTRPADEDDWTFIGKWRRGLKTEAVHVFLDSREDPGSVPSGPLDLDGVDEADVVGCSGCGRRIHKWWRFCGECPHLGEGSGEPLP